MASSHITQVSYSQPSICVDTLSPWSVLTDLTIGGALCTNFIPSFLLQNPTMRLYDIPVHYYLFSLGALFLIFEAIARSYINPYIVAALLCYVLMLLRGLMLDNTPRWILTDSVIFGGLIVGMTWAGLRRPDTMPSYLKMIVFIGILFFLVNLVFSAGVQQYTFESKNVVALPFWSISSVLAYTMPFVYVGSLTSLHPRAMRWINLLALAAAACTLCAAVITVTRTILGQALFAAGVILYNRTRMGKVIAVLLATLTLCILSGSSSFNEAIHGLLCSLPEVQLFQKLQSDSILQDPRVTELEQLLDHMEGNELWGLGLGSRYSYVLRPLSGQTELVTALAPHLGAFGFYQKGGLPIYLLFIVVPFIWSIHGLFLSRSGLTCRRPALCGILCYVVFASCSTGGWDFVYTFLYGAFLMTALTARKHDLRS